VHSLWLVGWLVSLGIGLFLVILAGMGLRGDDLTIGVAFGVDFFILSIFCFIMMFRKVFAGSYRYLVRPALIMICVQTSVTASIILGNFNLRNEEAGIALFFIIFPIILLLAVLFIPARLFGAPAVVQTAQPAPVQPRMTPGGAVSPARRLTALLLALLGPMGLLCGLQRFYVGKIGTGILWLFTGGLMGIGQVIDIILIAVGQFTDKDGLPLVMWSDPSELTTVAMPPQAQAAAGAMPQAPAAVPVEPAQPVLENAPHQPAVNQPPSWPSYASAATVYEPFDPIGGLFAAVGHIFAFAAIVIGVIVGVHLPALANAAWPNAEPVMQLQGALGESWPGIVEQVGTMLVVVLLFMAAILIMIGRRRSGPAHLMRALLSLLGFFFAIMLFRNEAMSQGEIQNIVGLFQSDQVNLALERLFRVISQEEAMVAAVIMLVSVLFMSWPPRRRMPVFAPMPPQGVVL
jgi:hypothetical protein